LNQAPVLNLDLNDLNEFESVGSRGKRNWARERERSRPAQLRVSHAWAA
jgi:hypothetical protein